MTLKDFLAQLIVEETNLRCLHWCAYGKHFDRAHALADEYRKMVSEDIDTIAEYSDMLETGVCNIPEAMEILDNSERDFLIVDTSKNYNKKTIQAYINMILREIVDSLQILLSSDDIQNNNNVGIRSDLETICGKYDKQLRYLNKRRQMDED